MSYRPYPNADRALRQLARHARPIEVPEWRVKVAADAGRALAVTAEAMGPLHRMGRAASSRAADREWERALDGPYWQQGLKVVGARR